eukprot:6995326-Pyramimonas_sp.AAC.1
MRLPVQVQRFVAPEGAPTTVPVAQSACDSCAQCGVSRPHPIGSSTEGLNGAVRVRLLRPVRRFVAS